MLPVFRCFRPNEDPEVLTTRCTVTLLACIDVRGSRSPACQFRIPTRPIVISQPINTCFLLVYRDSWGAMRFCSNTGQLLLRVLVCTSLASSYVHHTFRGSWWSWAFVTNFLLPSVLRLHSATILFCLCIELCCYASVSSQYCFLYCRFSTSWDGLHRRQLHQATCGSLIAIHTR